jgi:hypothetical protein
MCVAGLGGRTSASIVGSTTMRLGGWNTGRKHRLAHGRLQGLREYRGSRGPGRGPLEMHRDGVCIVVHRRLRFWP